MSLALTHLVQNFRTPELDTFFRALNFFDRNEFYFVLIPIVWVVLGWRPTARLLVILFLSSLVNSSIKALIAEPRPCVLDPAVGLIAIKDYSFPSGGAQTAALLSAILVTSWRSAWRWLVAGLYFALISFSRIYLGVHYLHDVFGGWIVGFSLFALYRYAFPPVELKLERLKSSTLLAWGLGIPLLCLLLLRAFAPVVAFASSALGMVSSLFLTLRWNWGWKATTEWRLGFRALGCLASVLVLYFALHALLGQQYLTLQYILLGALIPLWGERS